MFVVEKSAEGEELKPKRLVYCASHIQAMQNQKKQCHDLHPVTIAWLMPWDDNLSHGLTQAVKLSGVIPLFTRKQRLEDFSPSLYKENIIFGAGRRKKGEKKEGGLRQRIKEVEIIKELGD